MTDLTPEQDIKSQLVILSVYLQCEPLSDAQVRLYAPELADLGPEGLRKAITRLKGDPTLWPGKFPLPAKIRSYLMGDVHELVSDGLAQIMACRSQQDVLRLPRFEYEVVQGYGTRSVVERDFNNTATIYAQLRDALRAKYLRKVSEARIGLAGDSAQIGTDGGPGLEDQGQHGASPELATGPDSASGV